MSDVQSPLKKRLVIMAAVNVVAVVIAGAMLAAYLKLNQAWALPGFVAAMGVGFGAQVWFIAGLRQVSSLGKANSLDNEPARGARMGKGA